MLKNKAISIISFFLLMQLIFFIIIGENSYLEIHDNLDSVIVWLKNMRDYKIFWDFNAKVPMLNGLNRNYFPSEWQIQNIIYYIFPMFPAYLIVYFSKIFLGIFSFFLLCKELGKEYNKELSLLIGFSFALLYGYTGLYFAQVSIPLIVYFLLKLEQTKNKKYYIYIFFYPVLSEFTRYGIFILGFLTCFILYQLIMKRILKKELIIALIILSVGYILTEYRLFQVMLFSNEKSMRSIVNLGEGRNFFKVTIGTFLGGQYHAQSLHRYIILPVCLFYFIKELKKDKFNILKFLSKIEVQLFIFVILNCIICGIYEKEWSRNIIENIIPPLKGWNFSRTIWFNPILWYVLFYLIVLKIKNKKTVTFLVIGQILLVIFKPTYSNDFGNTIYNNFFKKNTTMNYKEFFSEKLFNKIKDDLKYSNEKSVAVGFHPSVLNYNNIFTLDGYHNAYSLSYRNQFRKLIQPELELNENKRKYFDAWSGRAYIYSKDIGYEPIKEIEQKEINLNIDKKQFFLLGGKYIFSRAKIKNFKELNLKFINSYSEESSPYIIYLYELGENNER
ncbi:DUF6044 family protein [uncultured Fusobacterium sp.]|uniref:DUF6044 family protein n=1 Tax=uncultured Fusobacterium sp. TaxID=159267 RepID=UPI0025EF5CEA|nr:DUF6044 family protein [uncultured Fusobacterium sp.]